ncbi:MAG: FKBP-type peptidyl-prolyl cis-trans isomerase [Candidatus Bathyarchaeota archaeon]|nr:MAG: FKBP-type peptidyl-prolyl cis-trans isomerase [Candidatus Bathyarchaeota archaeon]
MSEEEKAPTEEAEEEKAEAPEEQPKEKPKKKRTAKKTKKKAKKKVEKPVIAEGDFILVEMMGRAVETGDVFDTTDEEQAKEEGIHDENKTYGPKLVVVGEGWILKGLDDRLAGLKLEEAAEVEIPPEDAFGERSPENVRTMPYRVLRSKGINPAVGGQVEIDGRTAMVRSVGAGRVQLDYNHPLAGRRIVYQVKATRRYEGEEEKIRALIGRRFLGIDLDMFKLKLLKKKVRIVIPEEIFFGENIQIAKRGVALDIQRFFPNVDEIEYNEVIKRSA